MFINFRFKPVLSLGAFLLLISFLFSVYITYDQKNVQATAAPSGKSVSLPIVMYHGILKDKNYQGEYVISPDEFKEDLKSINKLGFTTVVMEDVINYVYNRAPLPEKPIMLTFDDGYYNNYMYAYPLLKEYGCRAVISPVVYYTEEYSKSLDLNGAYANVTWDNLREMSKEGVFEVQNHSYNMHKSSGKRKGVKQRRSESDAEYKSALTGDVSKAQKMFKNELNITPTTFVYPFGAKSDLSAKLLKEMGFKATMTCEEKINTVTTDRECLYDMGRYLRKHDTDSLSFFEKLHKECGY